MSDEVRRLVDVHAELREREMDIHVRLARHAGNAKQIEKSLVGNDDTDDAILKRVFGGLGVLMPDAVRERYENVAIFHASIVSNRVHHLGEMLENHRANLAKALEELAAVRTMQRSVWAELQGVGAVPAPCLEQAKARLVETPPGF